MIARRLWPLLPLGVTAAGIACYLVREQEIAGTRGLPLDDAWIHLTLARNLVHGLGFGINPGQTVGASTAPLWTLLLAPVVGLAGPSTLAIRSLGIGLLLIGLELTRRLYLAYRPDRPAEAALAAAVVGVLPSSLWGALSGLEVSLAIVLTAASLLAHARVRDGAGGWRGLAPSFLMGLAALARPEALLLFPLALLDGGRPRDLRRLAGRVLAFAAPLAPVVVFHLAAHGAPLPTTFYAKIHHSRHAAGGQGLFWALARGGLGPTLELFYRWSFVHLGMALRSVLAVNPFLLLAAGAGLFTGFKARGSDGGLQGLVPLTFILIPWTIGVVTPRPDFGAGDRYLAFLNPAVGVLGAAGVAAAARRLPRWPAILLGLLAVAPFVTAADRGARLFGWSVKNTEEMHVRLARWARDALPPGATAAVHDIGALAFFAHLRLLDLEGIGSPDLLPSKRSPEARFAALSRLRPDYLIIAPNWYPDLDRRRDVFTPIHVQEIPPGENHVLAGPTLVVYRARWPDASRVR